MLLRVSDRVCSLLHTMFRRRKSRGRVDRPARLPIAGLAGTGPAQHTAESLEHAHTPGDSAFARRAASCELIFVPFGIRG
jgi:hypothetical protein